METIIENLEQRSQEWFYIRAGKVTASRLSDVLAKIRTGEAATRRNYKIELVTERLTGIPVDTYQSQAMLEGIEREPMARELYELYHDIKVELIGFVDHPTIALSGASPDGLVLDNGLIEIKCPQPLAHTETLLSGEIPTKYIPQLAWQLACTGREWCDFVSYNPLFPENLQLFVKRYHREDTVIASYEKEVIEFLTEVDEIVKKMEKI